jgi:purine-cytosine permease-like protein
MTLLAGAVATVAAVFPALAFKLLGFVGLYGTILTPVGGIIFADWYLARAAGVEQFPTARSGEKYNLAVLFAWLLPVGVALWLITVHGVTTWYFPLPAWIACAALYLLFRKWTAPAAART